MLKSSAPAPAGRRPGRTGAREAAWKPAARNEARKAAEAHRTRVRMCLDAVDPAAIAAAADHLLRVAGAGGLILIAGNGGSGATASHMALDFGKAPLGRPARRGIRAVRTISLADPAPVLTAWANDEGYEGVFAEQVTTLARPGDGVVLLSVSGTSPNIVAAARAARAAGATVVALTGNRVGGVRRLADFLVAVPSEDYQVVEDVHLAVSHMITSYLAEALTRSRRPATRRSSRKG